MSNCGATLIAPAGYADAARGNLYGDFEDWLDIFWAAESVRSTPSSNNTQLQKDQLQEDFGGTTMDIDISTDARASSLRYDVSLATVTENRVLTGPGEQQIKCHMEVELPPGTTYECGDYLAVLPLNSEKNVRRIMAHFGLPWDAVVTVKATGSSTIPANVPLSVFDVLRSYVELSQPATKKVCIDPRKENRPLTRHLESQNSG
jgi:cytochrome P450/NADPH-cytochrome P450 reductase